MRERSCRIFRCGRKREMYLYLDESASPDELPEELRRDLGRLEEVMVLAITAERRLARADASRVLEAIESQGYYLQLPPTMEPGVFTHGG